MCWTSTLPYSGKVNVTKGGLTCQHWSSQDPQTHNYDNDAIFPLDGSVENAANYCRDPDETYAPWCFTVDPNVRWDWCNISLCNSKFRRVFVDTHFSFCCEKNADLNNKLTTYNNEFNSFSW